MFIIGLVSVYALSWGMTSRDVHTKDTLEKINQWTSLAASLVPVPFIMHFLTELTILNAANARISMRNSLKTIFGAVVGIIGFVSMLGFGVMLATESNSLNMQSCDLNSKRDRKLLERNYDSLLALKNSPPIERKLRTPNPSREAEALYRFLLEIYGKRILSGQMWAPWGYDELKYIQEKTGKQPAIRGMDFIHQKDNEAEVKHAIEWWNSGGIPTIMWHWGGPGLGEGYENSKGRIDIDKCFIEGTKEYSAFWSELKTKADLLEKIRDAHVPVLWRPYHELNGNWFWYGKQGPERFKKLWITMYNYFVNERGLNNLIWVLCYTGSPNASWFPGEAYVDIAGADSYDGCDEPHVAMYSNVKAIVKNNPMPIAYHECGVPPDPDACLDSGAMWSWWMEWHTGHLKKIDVEYLNMVYHHKLVITKDELPDIMKVYAK
jgi:hypothetical protein